jgi:hypothetical protein
VLNRSDELGVDPSDDPDEFDRLAQRKQVELIKAFARRRVEIPDGRVICMASDPFGLVGERRDVNAAQYDAYRSWDGFNTFITSIKDLRSEALRVGADIAALEGGMARVGELRRARRRELAEARAQVAFTKRLYQLLDVAASEASRIRGHIEARLDSLLDQTTQAHIQDAMGAATDDEIQEAANALSRWWKDEAFKTNLERWEKESRTAIDRWFTRTHDEVGRRMQSKEFLRAHPEARSAFDAASMGGKESAKGAWAKIFQSVVQAGSKRNVVYDVGKFFGTKFRPWEATKLAAKIGRFAPYLAGIGVVLDAWDWHRAAKSGKKREAARKEATHFLHRSSDEVRKSLLAGNGRSEGPCAYLEDVGAEVITLRDAIGTEIGESETAVESGAAHIQVLTDVLADARDKLGLPPEEVTNA